LEKIEKSFNFALVIDIIQHIQYLVSRHDCVILPGWGAIVAQHVPACVSDGILYPPVRKLGFNPAVNHNDGMLAHSVARREGISYDSAVAAVTAAIAKLRNLYDVAGLLALPRIGTLRRDSSGTMSFIPVADAKSIANIAFFELPVMEVVDNARQESASEAVVRLSGLRAFARGAAAVAAMIALGITLTTPVIVNRADTSFASVPAPKVTAAKAVNLPLAAPADSTLFIAVPNHADATDTLKLAPAPAAVAAKALAPTFYLIVSSHANRAEANAYVAARPDEKLTVFESDRRFRIVAATGSSFNEAVALKSNADFSRRHPDAWVLRK
jgi:hypothetical protein